MRSPADIDDALRAALAAPRPRSVPEAVARMVALEGIMGPADGLFPFTHLYRLTTERVGAKPGTFWRDPTRLEQLDTIFAEAYFEALRRWLGPDPESAPSAWKVLFRVRHQPGISPLRRALAGMNAHINRDLAPCAVAVFAETGDPGDESDMHADFERVNEVLAEVEPTAKQKLFEWWLRELDEAAGEVDDLMALWSIDKARDLAWVNARALWTVREEPRLHDALLAGTDKLASYLGRMLLG